MVCLLYWRRHLGCSLTSTSTASSTLVRIPGHGSILLDAGEGTWGQLARLYGDDGQDTVTGVWEVLRDLRCIFASHMHGDHHLGLSKILAMRKLVSFTIRWSVQLSPKRIDMPVRW